MVCPIPYGDHNSSALEIDPSRRRPVVAINTRWGDSLPTTSTTWASLFSTSSRKEPPEVSGTGGVFTSWTSFSSPSHVKALKEMCEETPTKLNCQAQSYSCTEFTKHTLHRFTFTWHRSCFKCHDTVQNTPVIAKAWKRKLKAIPPFSTDPVQSLQTPSVLSQNTGVLLCKWKLQVSHINGCYNCKTDIVLDLDTVMAATGS